jgi:hypothetical protein
MMVLQVSFAAVERPVGVYCVAPFWVWSTRAMVLVGLDSLDGVL